MMQPYRPTLHGLPDDTSGRFAALREFLLRWHGLATGTVGRTVDRVTEAESQLHKRLPLAVREWIVLLDDLERIDAWGHVLRDSWSLKKVPGRAAFSLLLQGEGDRHWGPLLRDLDEEDPPTHEFTARDGDGPRFDRGRQVAPRVSTWAIAFILRYLHLSRSLQVERTTARSTIERLRARAPEGLVASQIGEVVLLEFAGGLICAESDGPDSYRLQCYAPTLAATNDGYHAAAAAFAERIDEILRASTP